MSRINLQFSISGQRIQRNDNIPLAANSIGFVGAHFSFDSSWNGLVKTAVFESISGVSYDVLLGTANECECNIASEVVECTENGGGRFFVSVRGVESSGENIVTRATADKVEIIFEESGSVSGSNTGTPTATVPEQVVSALAKSQWMTGTSIAGTGTGITASVENAVTGVHYLNTSNGNVYVCTQSGSLSSTWDYVTCLAGPKGNTGDKGDPGEPIKFIRTTQGLTAWLDHGFTVSSYCLICEEGVMDGSVELDVGDVYFAAKGNPGTFEKAFSLIGQSGESGATVSGSEKATWNGKYTKPSGGIPYSDMSSDIQGMLDMLDNTQTYIDASNNLVNSYAVYTAINSALGTVETELGGI